MSETKTPNTEETFTGKLDIHMVSTNTYIELLDTHAETPRLVIAAIGPSGIGKSAIPKQVAQRRHAPYVALHLPTMSIEDFHLPTTAADTKHYYDKRIPRRFQTLIDYVEKLRAENGGVFPEGRNPILAIEELNRAVDKAVTRATFTLLDDRMIGDVYLDDAIQIVVTMNPTGGGMVVNEFEKDPAMRRRLVMVGVTASYGDFMEHARKAKFHDKVLAHLDAQPSLLYDTAGAASNKKFACPASWDALSRICQTLDRKKIPLVSHTARAAFAGTIGATAAEMFVEYIQDATVVIAPEDVLSGYHPKSQVRERFKELINKSRLDKVSALASGLVMKLLADTKRKPSTVSKTLSLFMEDMPEEIMISFIRELVACSKTARDGHRYMQELNGLMSTDKAFNTALERLKRSQEKGRAEAEKAGV
jgi:MoxR-like ATPase